MSEHTSSFRQLGTFVFLLIGVLVANKIDLDQRRVVSPKSGREFAESNGLEYFECSAVSMQQC